ncbi:phytanoyl-CoA dioxygenase family protein [Aspergillus vadensis CBS 113365]|uniref:Phytanoyl-CoA dioxygenase n=1 Tax=Aspergillus vadensis (strain CBS 113365 / IMI 142717 / IBT 24658) TaxID=1448311 RepID=A0A319BYX3_ASPVC|nr:hypothetical protein BO88DRAFT_405778 [Aspergillus vadensis CBS 113365]PYH68358.1 hypothetical protein BO88DRAFT_405778 [Aspergillus vadensis CBS 113365]
MAPSILDQKAYTSYGDWRDEFYRNGYVVLKNVISREKALNYREKALDWLQSFNTGFDINDQSTWTAKNLPQSFKAGMYLNYCAAHEKYVWDARMEPEIINAFAKIWGTDELLVSFDTINITLPGRTDVEWSPWPHVDQAPERKGLSCVQGIINLSEAGPKDGGLMLMEGSSKLFDRFFKLNPPDRTQGIGAKHYDFYPFKEHHVKWYEEQGCNLIKVCAEPGDLILWDSRSMHYAKFPESDEIRTIIYACYTPASHATPEDLKKKAELFHRWETTTHWPHCNIHGHGKAMVDGKVDPLERDEPLEKPVMTDRLLQLAGVKSY